MCTVSFLPTAEGFHLAMNRDEQISRRAALPPEISVTGGHCSIYPREESGGSWIGVNDTGLTLALINWYAVAQSSHQPMRSRGEIIPALLGGTTIREVVEGFSRESLGNTNSFRLIVVSPAEKQLSVMNWNGRDSSRQTFPWMIQHWFSSGFDEAEASRQRQLTCARAISGSSARSIIWLRELHRSHRPKKGAFSICMHRKDARTVSYNEVAVTESTATMTYVDGPPCECGTAFTKSLFLTSGKFLENA